MRKSTSLLPVASTVGEWPVGKHIKEVKIYYDDNTVITLVVNGTKNPEVQKQDDHWEDERQQMLDDYD